MGKNPATRRTVLFGIIGAGFLGLPFTAFAQQKPIKVYRVGILSQGRAGTLLENLRANLRELNYVEGRNLVIEARFAEGKYERLPQLVAELVNLKVDVIVAGGTAATLAAKRATTTIPIVMSNVGDAVATGIVASLARPGGNITGTNIYALELVAKQLDLLKEALPHIRQVAVLTNPLNPTDEHILKTMETTAKALKVELQKFEPRGPHEFEAVFAAMAKKRVDALLILGETMFTQNARTIVDLAAKHRLPSIGTGIFSERGSLMSYGILQSEIRRRTAYFVDRILKGAKPADLPVELPTRFEFVVNLKTAKALGVTLPPSILARADRAIE